MADGEIMTQQANGLLKSFVERLERLESDKADIVSDTKEVMAEAKASGFDTKVLRKVVRRRAQDRAKLQEEKAIFDLYWTALGELPLFGGR